jgi:hypothetical protein
MQLQCACRTKAPVGISSMAAWAAAFDFPLGTSSTEPARWMISVPFVRQCKGCRAPLLPLPGQHRAFTKPNLVLGRADACHGAFRPLSKLSLSRADLLDNYAPPFPGNAPWDRSTNRGTAPAAVHPQTRPDRRSRYPQGNCGVTPPNPRHQGSRRLDRDCRIPREFADQSIRPATVRRFRITLPSGILRSIFCPSPAN